MQVSVETLKGLERKVTISVPTEKVEEEVSLRLRNLARKAKVDGFRPGKIPLNVIKQRYSGSVRQEVARDMVQSTLFDALKDKQLVPAGHPSIEFEQIEPSKDFCYTATFEVFPEININELNQTPVEIVKSSISSKDVNNMLDKLREQNKEWSEVKRSLEAGDKAVIDFEGFIDGVAFENGKGSDFEIVIGSGSMIPGFEEGLIGGEIDKSFDLPVTFPKDYGHQDVAGKEAIFKITIKKVMEGKLPKLDDKFIEKFNIKEGGVEAFKEDIQQNMERELERRISSMNREAIFDKLMEKNKFELPTALINQEIEHLKHEMYHRLFGPEHKSDERIPDFPRGLFEQQAQRRVHLGLLFSEYVKKHKIVVSKERVDGMIDKLATAYESPDELRTWYHSSKERLSEIEALVMEELVSEKILEDAKIVEKSMKYDEVMNPKKEKEKDEKDKKGA